MHLCWRQLHRRGGGGSEGVPQPDIGPPSSYSATEKNRSYVISSFTELKAYDLLSKAAVQFVEYP